MKIGLSLEEFQKQEKELLEIFQEDRKRRELAYLAENGGEILIDLFRRIKKIEDKVEKMQDKIKIETIQERLEEKLELTQSRI